MELSHEDCINDQKRGLEFRLGLEKKPRNHLLS